MCRRRRAVGEILPDAKFGDVVISRFMNALMYDGKKSVAEGTVCGALDVMKRRGGAQADPVRTAPRALDNVKRRSKSLLPRRRRELHLAAGDARSAARRWRSAGSSIRRASAASIRWKTDCRTSCSMR